MEQGNEEKVRTGQKKWIVGGILFVLLCGVLLFMNSTPNVGSTKIKWGTIYVQWGYLVDWPKPGDTSTLLELWLDGKKDPKYNYRVYFESAEVPEALRKNTIGWKGSAISPYRTGAQRVAYMNGKDYPMNEGKRIALTVIKYPAEKKGTVMIDPSWVRVLEMKWRNKQIKLDEIEKWLQTNVQDPVEVEGNIIVTPTIAPVEEGKKESLTISGQRKNSWYWQVKKWMYNNRKK